MLHLRFSILIRKIVLVRRILIIAMSFPSESFSTCCNFIVNQDWQGRFFLMEVMKEK